MQLIYDIMNFRQAKLAISKTISFFSTNLLKLREKTLENFESREI